MANAVYVIIIVLVGLYSLARGFRIGITPKLWQLLGFAFGAVCARVLSPVWADNFHRMARAAAPPEFSSIVADMLCSVSIYTCVYLLFFLTSPFLSKALAVIEVGIFNRLLGAFFTLVKNLLWISILLNLALVMIPGSDLLQYEKADDGNLVASVISLTPAILGCYGGEDFAHFHQLKEAKSISCNFQHRYDVINLKPNIIAITQEC